MLRYVANVVTLELDADKCIACELCTLVCPHGVLVMDADKARIVDKDACMECGACARNCPTEAIQVKAGVGCATAVIIGAVRGSEACCCDSSDCR
jgi:Pyruvate/2-oxoacid:ferredoxin oxidoreductase delta subunit